MTHPKFYWFDPGVARGAAGLLRDAADRTWLGLALETLVYHELRVYNSVSRKERALFYYRTPAGVGTRSYRFGKLDVLPLPRFIRALHDGNIF